MNLYCSIFLISLFTCLSCPLSGQLDTLNFNFFGHNLNVSYELIDMDYYYYEGSFPENIKEFEKEIDYYHWGSLLPQLQKIEIIYELDGFGMSAMVDNLINEMRVAKNDNQKVILKWIILKKLGYDVLLTCFEEGDLNLLGRYEQGRIHHISEVYYKNKYYFNLNFKEKRREPHYIYSDVIKNSDSLKIFALTYNFLPQESNKLRKKDIVFEYRDTTYSFRLFANNEQLINFFKYLPNFNLSKNYIDYPLSEEVQNSLYSQLLPLLKNKNNIEALSLLLSLTQKFIEHKPDFEYKGEENYMFPEETLFDSYADCEDKSMLFAFLVKNFLGLKTIVIWHSSTNENDYDHVNIGVEVQDLIINKDMEFINYEDKKFIICEPTGLNFPIGKNMTKIKDFKIEITPLF